MRHLTIIMMVMVMSELVTCSGPGNPLAILTHYLRVKTVAGCEGDLLDISCTHSDNKVTLHL